MAIGTIKTENSRILGKNSSLITNIIGAIINSFLLKNEYVFLFLFAKFIKRTLWDLLYWI